MRKVSYLSSRGDTATRLRHIEDLVRQLCTATYVANLDDILSRFTVENFTPTRSIDASTATTADLANFMGTLIDDIKNAHLADGARKRTF